MRKDDGSNRGTIATIIAAGLCTSCGTCVGTCPHGALRMTVDTIQGLQFPTLLQGACRNCGLCMDVCPGRRPDYLELDRSVFAELRYDDLIGSYRHLHLAHSKNHDIRHSSSSGGIVTEILVYLLEKRMIDGAIVVGSANGISYETKPYIARTKSEVMAASGSKYAPSSPNVELSSVLRGGGRYAVVGLPCQILGLRKAERAIDGLTEKIALRIGLFCGYSKSRNATLYTLRRFNINPDQVASLSYRGYGWPGSVRIGLRDGTEMKIPFRDFADSRFSVFVPWRCTLCNDQTNELADISVGDAWMKSMSQDTMGTSVVIARSTSASCLLDSLVADDRIMTVPTQRDAVVESQHGLVNKKIDLSARLLIARLFGRNVPEYCPPPRTPLPSSFLRATLFYAPWLMSSKPSMWGCLDQYWTVQRKLGKLVRCLRLPNSRAD